MREVYAIENWDDKILWDALDKSTDHIKSVANKH
jgi:hypothetical protein